MDNSLKIKEDGTLNRASWYTNVLTFLALLVLIIAVLVYLFVFTTGQIEATRAMTEVAQAISRLIQEGKSASDYASLVSDMQAAQQAYSQNASTNMLSVVYTVVTAIVLGYGVKLIRRNDEDRQKILFMENRLIQTEKELSEAAKSMESKMESSFTQHNKVYIATTSCRNAAHICTLLRSHIVLLPPHDNGSNNPALSSLQVDLIRSLKDFCDFLKDTYQKQPGLTPGTLKALQYSWRLAKNSLRAYIGVDGDNDVALINKVFPADVGPLRELYREIEDCLKELK